MKKALLAIALGVFSFSSFAETRDVKAETPTKSETKTQALYYWFDANNGQYIGRFESSGCDHSTDEECANGYTSVSNTTNPVEPSSAPVVIEHGKR